MCPTLCDPINCNPLGSSVPGIFQARILEWVVMSYSRGSSQSRIELAFLGSPALESRLFTTAPPGKPPKKSWFLGKISDEIGLSSTKFWGLFICVCLCVCMLSHVWLFATQWTLDFWAPLSMKFSRQEYWSGLPFHIPGYLSDPGIEPKPLASPALPLSH